MVFSMLQRPFWLIWSCPKNYLFSVGMSQGNFGRHESFRFVFVSAENVSYPYGSGRKIENLQQPYFHQKIIGDVLSLCRKFQETLFNNIIAISWYKNVNNTTSEKRVKLIRNPPNVFDEWNCYPEIFSFAQASEISRKYLLLRTVILEKTSLGAPKFRVPKQRYAQLLFETHTNKLELTSEFLIFVCLTFVICYLNDQ